jgi:hypothetical protein
MTRERKTTYKGVAGKVVERAESFLDDGKVFLRVQFADRTELVLVVAAQAPTITNAELLRWKAGNMSVVRSYTKPRP